MQVHACGVRVSRVLVHLQRHELLALPLVGFHRGRVASRRPTRAVLVLFDLVPYLGDGGKLGAQTLAISTERGDLVVVRGHDELVDAAVAAVVAGSDVQERAHRARLGDQPARRVGGVQKSAQLWELLRHLREPRHDVRRGRGRRLRPERRRRLRGVLLARVIRFREPRKRPQRPLLVPKRVQIEFARDVEIGHRSELLHRRDGPLGRLFAR